MSAWKPTTAQKVQLKRALLAHVQGEPGISARDNGERVTLASLWLRGLLERTESDHTGRSRKGGGAHVYALAQQHLPSFATTIERMRSMLGITVVQAEVD